MRLCEFIYRNLGAIAEICATMETHKGAQIFHPLFWINAAGENPKSHTMISLEDVRERVWKVNPAVVSNLEMRGCI